MTTKQLNDIIKEAQDLKLVSQSYSEIASSRLRKIRSQVERNRDYLEELSNVYQATKQVAINRKLYPKKNGRTISILITSNYHFYGDINSSLINFFINKQREQLTDTMVIGTTGLDYFKTLGTTSKYNFMVLKKDFPGSDELKSLVNQVKNYSRVVVYFSKLISSLVQEPTSLDISQTVNFFDKAKYSPESLFIFEPEISKILDFFDNQLSRVLLEQTFLEAELSRTGSRLISMSSAQNKADEYISDYKVLLHLERKTIINSRLLEVNAALMALGGHSLK